MLHVFDKDMSRWIMKTAHMWAKARAAKSTQPYSVIFKRCLQQVHAKARQMLDQHRQMREHVLSAFNEELFFTEGCGNAVQLRYVWNVLAAYNPFVCELTGMNTNRLEHFNSMAYGLMRDVLNGLTFDGSFDFEPLSLNEVQAKLARFVA